MAEKQLLDPRTGEAFGANFNPFEGKDIDDPTVARFFQKSFISSLGEYKPPTAPPVNEQNTLPDFSINSTEKLTGGSDGIRGQMSQNKSDASKMLEDLNATQDLATTDLTNRLANLDKLLAESRKLTEADLASINEQAAAAGREFDPLIAQAKTSAAQSLGEAVVGGGRRGGFMNTQISGQAAVPGADTLSFIGSGGVLSDVKGQLENNIQKLETAKINAISAARAAAEKAIRTGKQDDLQLAASIFDKAKETFKTQQDLISKRIEIMSRLESDERERIKFGQSQEDRAIESLAGSLSTVLGDDTDANMQLIQQEALARGVDPNRLITAINEKMRKESFFKSGDIVELMKAVPAGETQMIVDPLTGSQYEIQGLGGVNKSIVQVTDDKGRVRGVDKNTGEVVWETAPGVGKTKTNMTISLPRQSRTPIFDASGKQVGFQTFNPVTTQVENKDLTGNNISFPEGGRLGTFGSEFEDEGELF